MTTHMRQIRVWISPALHAFFQQQAIEHGTSVSEEARHVLEGPPDAQPSEPSTARPTAETVRLIQGAIEQRQWSQVVLTKLLDLLGEHDPTAQDARVGKVRDQITAYAIEHTQAFLDRDRDRDRDR